MVVNRWVEERERECGREKGGKGNFVRFYGEIYEESDVITVWGSRSEQPQIRKTAPLPVAKRCKGPRPSTKSPVAGWRLVNRAIQIIQHAKHVEDAVQTFKQSHQ